MDTPSAPLANARSTWAMSIRPVHMTRISLVSVLY